MKTYPAALITHISQRATTLASCLKVTRRDGLVLGLTSTDHELVISAVTYYPGFSPSDTVSSSGLDVENQEVTVIPGKTLLTQAELAAGIWDNAQFEVFEVNHKTLADGVTPSRRGTTGEAQINDRGIWTIEFRGLKQALQQSLGEVTSKTCRYRLGSTSMAEGGLCMVDLTTFTHLLTVTGVTSNQVFTASAAAVLADEYFVEGSVEFTSGDNDGYSQKVKVFAAGVFTTSIPMPFVVTIGDTFTAIAGCQKRHSRTTDNPVGVSDCIDKFDNVLNFGGEPHLLGVDGLTALPTPPT